MTYTCGVCTVDLDPLTVAEHLLSEHEPGLVGVEVEPTSETDARYWPVPSGIPDAVPPQE